MKHWRPKIWRTGTLTILFSILFGLNGPLWALNTQYGIRAFLCGGYPSGKGLWDWTDEQDKGTLQWGPGGGVGVLSRFQVNERFFLEGGLNCIYIQAAQTLDTKSYEYRQISIETPFQFITRLPFETSDWYLGAGPSLVFLFFDAQRNGTASTPGMPVMLALQVGLDYSVYKTDKSEFLISAKFVHPVSSPEYEWEKESSGSIRINRAELNLTWLLSPGRRNP